MHKLGILLTLFAAGTANAADANLEAILAKVAKYDYDQGRQPLLDLEDRIRSMPARDVEKRLVEFLASDSSIAGKDFICRQLSVIGSETSVPALAAMLGSAETAEMARYALERIPAPEALAALRAALSKAPEKARPGIVNTLGIRRDAQAVGALAKLTGASDETLAESSIAALGRIASPQALSALAALRKQGSEPAMEASLVAADHLASHGNRTGALEIYRELSATSSPVMMRIGGLQGLSAVAGKESIRQLRAAVADSDTRVQAAAIKSLNSVPGSEVTSAMVEDLPKLGPAGRVRMLTALAQRGDRSAVPVIVKSAKDEALEVRIAALDSLAVIGEPTAIGMLAGTAASTSAEEAERAAARSALDRMRGTSVDTAIVVGIETAPTPIKIEMIRSAGERGIEESAGVVLRSVSDPDRAVRREAFRALRETGGAAQVPDLLQLLVATSSASDRREIERALSSALRRSPPARSADVVVAYQQARTPEIRASLLQVMGQAGTKEVLPVLRESIKDSNPDLVRAAILGLTEWPDDEPMRELLTLAGETQNPAHQILALRGFLTLLQLPSGRSASEAVALLTSAMKLARQPDEKKAILGLLPRYPTPAGLALADAAAADADVANEAKMAVQRLRRSLQSKK